MSKKCVTRPGRPFLGVAESRGRLVDPKMARSGALGQVVPPCQVSEGGKPASGYSLSLAETG